MGGGSGRNARNAGNHITPAWIPKEKTRAARKVVWERVMN